jgi:hypothetical protein
MPLLPALSLAFIALPACNPDDAYCDKYVECREKDDKLDDDADQVCKEQLHVERDILAANKGDSCKKLQETQDEWRSCMVQIDDCDDFSKSLPQGFGSEPQSGAKCKSERKDYDEKLNDVGARCFALTGPEGEATP